MTGGAGRRLATLARGLGAAVVLAALLAGIPVALIALGADPRGTRLPSAQHLYDLLTSPDDGTILLTLTRVVGWACWAGFAVSTLVELAATVTTVTVPRLRALAALQRPAGWLVAAITAGLTTPAAAAATQPAPHAATVTVPADDPTTASDHGSGHEPSRRIAPGSATPAGSATALPWQATGLDPDEAGRLPRIRVGRYDSLWRLADRHLGAGTRWAEIYRLNAGHRQPDGNALTDPDHLEEGWILLLPADAVGATPPATADRPAPSGGAAQVVLVRPGDTLSGLAERHLGHGTAWADLFAANAGRPQPDGGRLTDPNLIRPGWRLALPTPGHHTGGAPEHRRTDGTGTRPGSDGRHRRDPTPTPTPTPTPSAGPSVPATAPPTTPTATPTGATPTPAAPSPTPAAASGGAASPATGDGPAKTPTASSRPAQETPTRDRVRLPSGSLVALSLAAAVATLAWVARTRHRSRRRPTDPLAPAPRELALPPAVEHLEEAWLAARRLTEDDELAEDQAEGSDADVHEPAAAPRAEADPPMPGLGAPVTDLAPTGGLGLTGTGATAAARGLLGQLLAGAGPAALEVVTTRAAAQTLLPDAADRFAGIEGVHVAETMTRALDWCEVELLRRGRLLTEADTDLAGYRQLPAVDPIPTLVLLAHTPNNPADTRRTDAVLQLGRDREIVAVFLGDWTAGVSCQLDPDGTVTASTAQAGLLAAGQQLPTLTEADALDLLAGLLPDTRGALDYLTPDYLTPATSPSTTVGIADAGSRVNTGTGEAAEATRPDVVVPGHAGPVLLVSVFGSTRLSTSDTDPGTSPRAKVRDLVGLLAVNADGLTGEQVAESLWPDAPPGRPARRLSATLAQTRRLLREITAQAEDVDLIPHTGGRYRLHPDLVNVDYWQFTAALTDYGRARQAADEPAALAALTRAGGAYGGELLADTPYRWAEPLRATARRQAADALTTLADALTDPAAALAALERAVQIDPHAEELYRRIMRLHAAAGRTDAVRRTLRLLEARLTDLDVDPDPETTALAAGLLRPRPRADPTRAGKTAAGRGNKAPVT